MTREEFDRKWANVPEEHAADCGVLLGTLSCTCGHQIRRRQRLADEGTIGAEERTAIRNRRELDSRRREQARSVVRNVVVLMFSGIFVAALPWFAGGILALWFGMKTFGWWACAYGLLPSNWLEPGDAARGPLGWLKAMVVGIH